MFLGLIMLITLNKGMRTIDITEILSPDLKSRARVHDLCLYIQNSGETAVTLDFSNVQFATRSFMDEFYNVLLKNPQESPARVEITNVPEDINTILEAVSRTQSRAKVIPSRIPERSFRNVDELVKYLKAA